MTISLPFRRIGLLEMTTFAVTDQQLAVTNAGTDFCKKSSNAIISMAKDV
jgi:hypothetical protein